MRRLATACFLTLLLAPDVSALVSQDTGTASEIRTRTHLLLEAMRAKNPSTLQQLLATEFVLRGTPDVDRDTWVRNAVALCWGDRHDIDGFRATPIGDTLVASFELTFYVDPATCQPATLRSLITDVWVREGDEWRLRIRHSGPPPAGGVAGQFGLVPEPPTTWDVSGELSLVATGGNTSTNTLGLGTEGLHRSGRTTSRAAVAFVRTETRDVTQARSLLATFRHGVQLREKLEIFGQALFAQDRFAGIDARTSVEGGVAYTATLPRSQTFTAETGLGYTSERRVDTADVKFAIGTASTRYSWTVRRGMDLTEDLNVIADLERGRNWRARNMVALTIALSRLLSFRASHQAEYRNEPVEGFGRTDTRTALALVLGIRR